MRRLLSIILLILVTSLTLAAQSFQSVRQEQADEAEGRALVEGFYGEPWSQDFRLSMVDLAARSGFKEYVYAAKNDPYVGGEDWFMPYPEGLARQMKELMAACEEAGLRFTWCVRPDKDYSWSEADYTLLLGKFEMMHYMGVRSFGIFMDDMPGGERRKRELVSRVNSDFMAKKRIGSLLVSIDGDYAPESEGEVVRLGMYEDLDLAAQEMVPDAKDAFVRFVRNSKVWAQRFSETEADTPALIAAEGYDKAEYDALMEFFVQVEAVPVEMSKASNKALYNEMKPWFEEFGKLGTRCRKVLECMALYAEGDIPGFWSTYASNLMSEAEKVSYAEYPSGTERLQPFYERMMDTLADAFDMDDEARVEYTHVEGDGVDTYIAPAGTSLCHLIMNNPDGQEVIVRLSDKSGKYTAEFLVRSSYFKFDMKGDAVKVEVIGDVPVFDTVFVK